MIYYRWNYSWREILKLYQRKQSDWVERRQIDFDFLVQLATAALGGKSSGDSEIGLDDGAGLDDLTDEQLANLKSVLGQDFAKMYPQYADEELEE